MEHHKAEMFFSESACCVGAEAEHEQLDLFAGRESSHTGRYDLSPPPPPRQISFNYHKIQRSSQCPKVLLDDIV